MNISQACFQNRRLPIPPRFGNGNDPANQRKVSPLLESIGDALELETQTQHRFDEIVEQATEAEKNWETHLNIVTDAATALYQMSRKAYFPGISGVENLTAL